MITVFMEISSYLGTDSRAELSRNFIKKKLLKKHELKKKKPTIESNNSTVMSSVILNGGEIFLWISSEEETGYFLVYF